MALPTTERLFCHCGAHTDKPESAVSSSLFLITKLCRFLWHVGFSYTFQAPFLLLWPAGCAFKRTLTAPAIEWAVVHLAF